MKYYIQDTRETNGDFALWWKKDRCGYTTDIDNAGLFDEETTAAICKRRDTDRAWSEDYVKSVLIRAVNLELVEKKREKIEEIIV